MTLHLKPAEGKRVRDYLYPHAFMPDEGMVVAEHPYWWRKLMRGDVVIVVPVPVEKPKPRKTTEETR